MGTQKNPSQLDSSFEQGAASNTKGKTDGHNFRHNFFISRPINNGPSYDPNEDKRSHHNEIWVSMRENLSSELANNKGADQPAHPLSLISYFVIFS